MDRQLIITAFKESIQENHDVIKSIFGDDVMPEDIEETILSISSLDFADLLISVENRLGIEFAEECLAEAKTKIGELADIIERKIC